MKSNVNQGCTAKTLHNTLSDCAYLFKNLRFLTVTVWNCWTVKNYYYTGLSLHPLLSALDQMSSCSDTLELYLYLIRVRYYWGNPKLRNGATYGAEILHADPYLTAQDMGWV